MPPIYAQWQGASHEVASNLVNAPAGFTYKDPSSSNNTAQSLGGFREESTGWAWWKDRPSIQAKIMQARYQKNKFELNAALSNCRDLPATCHPNIKAFADMLKEARAIPDPAKQLAAVGGYVNLAVDYDYEENNRNDPDNATHLSMVAALKQGKGVCDEHSQLKLFAWQYLHPDTHARWIAEGVQGDQGKRRVGHAVVAVPFNGTHLVANSYKLTYVGGKAEVSFPAAREGFLYAAQMETVEQHVVSEWKPNPLFSFNSEEVHRFVGASSKTLTSTVTAQPQSQRLDMAIGLSSDDVTRKGAVQNIMKLAHQMRGLKVLPS